MSVELSSKQRLKGMRRMELDVHRIAVEWLNVVTAISLELLSAETHQDAKGPVGSATGY